jgi:hypothetical protein
VSGDADMHFGSNGFVGIFYSATSDDESNITATAQQAIGPFESFALTTGDG